MRCVNLQGTFMAFFYKYNSLKGINMRFCF